MILTLKLFATLAAHLPPEARKAHQTQVDLEEGGTVQALIDRYRLPPALCSLVLLNGVFVPPGERAARTLAPGDVLAIWPPVGGG